MRKTYRKILDDNKKAHALKTRQQLSNWCAEFKTEVVRQIMEGAVAPIVVRKSAGKYVSIEEKAIIILRNESFEGQGLNFWLEFDTTYLQLKLTVA